MAKRAAEKPLEALYDAAIPDAPVAYHDFYKTNGFEHPPFVTEGPSLTRQEFAAECDINTIMATYDGYLSDPMRSVRVAQYVDFTSVPSTLMESMQVLNEARDAFYRLPAVVRREFDNDPAMWADFASNPENLEQMREWGLAPPAPAPEPPQKVEVVNSAPSDAKPPQETSQGSTHAST